MLSSLALLRSRLSRIPLGRALIALGIVLVGDQHRLGDLGRAQGLRTHRAARAARFLQRDAACSPSRPPRRSKRWTSSCATRRAGERGRRGRRPRRACAPSSRMCRRSPRCWCSTPTPTCSPAAKPTLSTRRASRCSARRGAEGRYISDPYPDERGRWRFLISRHLGGPRSAAMAAAIELEGFDQRYGAIDLGRGAFITLLSYDGAIIARAPDAQGARPALSRARHGGRGARRGQLARLEHQPDH